MKIITYSRVGYNIPSGANWAYGIWKVDAIDTDEKYCMCYTVRESFGGDSSFRTMLADKTGHRAIESKGVYPSQKCTGIKDMMDMESEEFIETITAFLK